MEVQESLLLPIQAGVPLEIGRQNDLQEDRSELPQVKRQKGNEYLYLLRLESDKYYVGKSCNVEKRFGDHVNGFGSAWTKLYKPLEILLVQKVLGIYDETNLTKDTMRKYGIENVRGGPYCDIELDYKTKQILIREISTDTCYVCDSKSHMSKDCPSRKCYNCGDLGHLQKNCQKQIVCYTCNQTGHTKDKCIQNLCYKCHKPGHYAKFCNN